MSSRLTVGDTCLLRCAAGLSILPPASPQIVVEEGPRPHGHGPLVLFSGGALPLVSPCRAGSGARPCVAGAYLTARKALDGS